MKKVIAVICFMVWFVGTAIAGNAYPQIQTVGASSSMTITAIQASTIATLALSTPTGDSSSYTIFKTTGDLATYREGWLMPSRLHTEIFNDSAHDVWIGGDVNVSTSPGVHYGRRIPVGASWSLDSQMNFYVIAGTDTAKKIVITQEK